MALAVGLVVVAVALAFVLSGSPETLERSSATRPLPILLGSVPGGGSACQAGETVPAGTSAIGVSLKASAGPRVSAKVLVGETLLSAGESASGWVGKLVTIPVRPLARTVRDATICVAFKGADEQLAFLGVRTPRDTAHSSVGLLPGRMTIEYLRRGSSSWLSLGLLVARRMGLGRAWAGGWIAVLVASMMAGAIAVAAWLTARRPT